MTSGFDHFEITYNNGPRSGPTEIAVAGEVDLATAPELKRALFDALDAGARNLTLDMAAVELIDATGIGVLVGAATRAEENGGHLIVRSPSQAVQRVLAALDMKEIIQIEI